MKIQSTEKNLISVKIPHTKEIASLITLLVWPLMLAIPLLLTSSYSIISYESIFPKSWYSYDPHLDKPKPLGLSLGILAVAVGQFYVILFFYIFRYSNPLSIQQKGAPSYDYLEGVKTQLSQPEGFVLLTLYLSGTWMLRLMPSSYYSFEGGINYAQLFACLVIQDGAQYLMHRMEHVASPAFYRLSHKPHHRFTNPRLFDAFNGSLFDTICMILIPLYITALSVHCNVWTYMAFGSVYANWLTLIHSEYVFPWDFYFRKVGFGTPADHHVHHKFFKFNFGHLFMWFDWICGTYRDPKMFNEKVFHKNV